MNNFKSHPANLFVKENRVNLVRKHHTPLMVVAFTLITAFITLSFSLYAFSDAVAMALVPVLMLIVSIPIGIIFMGMEEEEYTYEASKITI